MKLNLRLFQRLCLGLVFFWSYGVARGELEEDARKAEESLQSLTAAAITVRTNAIPDLPFLLNSLKKQRPDEQLVVQQGLPTELMRRQVGPYILLPRQHGAIYALRVWASEAGPLVPILIDALGSEELVLASASAAALGVMGRHASSALPSLMNAAKSERVALSRNAVAALGDISGSDPEVVALLMQILKERRDMFTRENAVISLGKQGEIAAEASATLRGLLHEPERIAMHAAQSLASIAPDDPDTLKAFEGMLQSDSYFVRRWGLLAVSRLGGSKSVIDLLERAATDTMDYEGDTERIQSLANSILKIFKQDLSLDPSFK